MSHALAAQVKVTHPDRNSFAYACTTSSLASLACEHEGDSTRVKVHAFSRPGGKARALQISKRHARARERGATDGLRGSGGPRRRLMDSPKGSRGSQSQAQACPISTESLVVRPEGVSRVVVRLGRGDWWRLVRWETCRGGRRTWGPGSNRAGPGDERVGCEVGWPGRRKEMMGWGGREAEILSLWGFVRGERRG